MLNRAVQQRLERAGPIVFVLVAGLAAFTAYAAVYAFRKPFTAATFSGLEFWGLQYKIALVIAQVAGYALSKFIGIRIIAGLRPEQRAKAMLWLVGVACFSLIGFALSPIWLGPFWFFINGLPLGMVWGVVFSYLEGRRSTEALAAMLCVNFIISSGFVKTVGKWLIEIQGVSEFWMPLCAGLIFLPFLGLCLWVLEQLPPPSPADVAARSARVAMDQTARKMLFNKYALGLSLLVGIYLVLTIVRDVRDNFAVELWTELGFGQQSSILTTAELPIAFGVLVMVALLGRIKNNFNALWTYHLIFVGGAVLMLGSTLLFQVRGISPLLWMILAGTGAMLPYIVFNGAIFDRLLAAFRESGNVGFLMYIADAIGYLGSVLVMLWRNFGRSDLSWVSFFADLCLGAAGLMLLLTGLSWVYFSGWRKRSLQ
jgi:hypothetical protein